MSQLGDSKPLKSILKKKSSSTRVQQQSASEEEEARKWRVRESLSPRKTSSPSPFSSSMSPSGSRSAYEFPAASVNANVASSQNHDIFAYLDAVEATADRQTEFSSLSTKPIHSPSSRSNNINPSSSTSSSSSSAQNGHSDLAATGDFAVQFGGGSSNNHSSSSSGSVVSTVKAKLQRLKKELEDKQRVIELLEEEKTSLTDQLKVANAEHTTELQEQERVLELQHEEVVQRHLTFIDKLLSDKEELSQKCEDMAGQITSLMAKFKKGKQLDKTNHAIALKKQKEAWAAAEKIRRETWIKQKTKDIKATTIKGLEPEIKRLLQKNKDDMKKADESREEAIKLLNTEFELEAERRLLKQKKELREEFNLELEKERDQANMKLREKIEMFEGHMREQRKALQQEFEMEKARALTGKDLEQAQLEEQLQLYRQQDEKRFAAIRHQHREEMEALRRSGKVATQQALEKADMERQQWQDTVLAKLNKQLKDKEVQLREKLARDRDEELEMVIERLEREHREKERARQNDLDDRAAGELEQVRRDLLASQRREEELMASLSKLQNKGNLIREDHKELEATLSATRLELSEKNAQVQNIHKRNTALNERLRDVEADLLELKEKRTEETSKELAYLKGQLRKQEKKLEKVQENTYAELERQSRTLEREKEDEMKQLHVRIQATIKKKDALIEQLRETLASKERELAALQNL